MAKANNKTTATRVSADAFIDGQKDEGVRDDCRAVLKLMSKATGEAPKMWGASIVGFGHFPMKYASGRELEWFYRGFSPRKQNLTLYIMDGFESYATLMKKLGEHSTGKSCLYVKRLSDIDMGVLEKLVNASVKHMKKMYPGKA